MNKQDEFNKYYEDHRAFFLSTIRLKNDIVYYSKNHDFFLRLKEQFKIVPRLQDNALRTLIVNLNILLKEGENYSLNNLIKKYTNATEISKGHTDYVNVVNDLNNLKSHRMCLVIKNLRDKYYAHLAINRESYDAKMSIQELNEFVVEILKVYQKICSLIEPGKEYSMNINDTFFDMFLFEAAAKYVDLSKLCFDYTRKNRKQIPTNRLMEILKKNYERAD